jgi:hypothetical protein
MKRQKYPYTDRNICSILTQRIFLSPSLLLPPLPTALPEHTLPPPAHSTNHNPRPPRPTWPQPPAPPPPNPRRQIQQVDIVRSRSASSLQAHRDRVTICHLPDTTVVKKKVWTSFKFLLYLSTDFYKSCYSSLQKNHIRSRKYKWVKILWESPIFILIQIISKT